MSSKNFGSSDGATSWPAKRASETAIRHHPHDSFLVSRAAGVRRAEPQATAGRRTRARVSLVGSRVRDQLLVQRVEAPFLRREAADLAPAFSHRRRARPAGAPRLPGTISSSAAHVACGATRRTFSSRPAGLASSRRRITPRSARRSWRSRDGESRHQAACDQDREAIGEALDVAQVMRGEEHRLALAPPVADEAVEGAETIRVEGRGRLVEEQHRRVREHGHGQAEALDHAARVVAHGASARTR